MNLSYQNRVKLDWLKRKKPEEPKQILFVPPAKWARFSSWLERGWNFLKRKVGLGPKPEKFQAGPGALFRTNYDFTS